MRQLTIHIPESKFQFILELLRRFNFVKIDTPLNEGYSISEAHKILVNEELEKINNDPTYLLDWDEVKTTLKFN